MATIEIIKGGKVAARMPASIEGDAITVGGAARQCLVNGDRARELGVLDAVTRLAKAGRHDEIRTRHPEVVIRLGANPCGVEAVVAGAPKSRPEPVGPDRDGSIAEIEAYYPGGLSAYRRDEADDLRPGRDPVTKPDLWEGR